MGRLVGMFGRCMSVHCLNLPFMQQLKEEMLSAYQQLKALCGQLRRREKQRRTSSDSLDVDSTVSSSSSSTDELTTIASVKVKWIKSIFNFS